MAQESLVVGKHTLESLTVGMYADNRIIFREYVQNATDAIDKAITAGILKKGDGQIDISIDLERREVRFRDNGIGIPSQDVYHNLGDIGKSEKIYSDNRGFRGIGRLGGLGYCAELQFITSYSGEDCKTIMRWDARELRKLLQPNNSKFEGVIEVIGAVVELDTQPEQNDAHYFEVVLSGIGMGHENLLDVDNICHYLSQVTPVPFDYSLGIELQRINQKLESLGVTPEEYKIFLDDLTTREQIYKPYRRKVKISDKKRDFIKDIEFFEGYKEDGSLFFVGWYGVTDLSGMIKEDCVNGLRVRKRNILIGDNRTLDEFFGSNRTYQNFNRWFVGEIYVFDENLIPNARRDNFERNEIYYAFKEEVEKTTHKLARLPHPHSKIRATDRRLKEIPQQMEEIKKELVSTGGITESRKEKLIEQVDDLRKKVKTIDPKVYDKTKIVPSLPDSSQIKKISDSQGSPRSDEVQQSKKEILETLTDLQKEIETSKNFVSDHLPSTISRACRKEIDKIFNVIDRVLEEGLAKELKEKIVEELQQKSKTEKHK